jgi:hypothetical protein
MLYESLGISCIGISAGYFDQVLDGALAGVGCWLWLWFTARQPQTWSLAGAW